MVCEKCGNELKENSMFCIKCGHKIGSAVTDKKDTSGETKINNMAGSSENTVPNTLSVNIKKLNDIQESIKMANDMQQDIQNNNVNTEQKSALEEKKNTYNRSSQNNKMAAGKNLVFCVSCGNGNPRGDAFCNACGKPLNANKAYRGKANKLNKKIVKGIVAVAVAGCIITGAIAGGLWAADNLIKPDTLIYLKDNNLMGLKNGKPFVIDEDICDKSEAYYGKVMLSEDGKYVYYLKETKSERWDLYRKQFGSKKAEAEEIATDVYEYSLLQDNKLIYSNYDYKIYLTDFNEKRKIATEGAFCVSSDKKYFMWEYVDENEVRCFVEDVYSPKDEIEIGEFIYASNNFEIIVYIKDDKLCYIENLEEEYIIDDKIYQDYDYIGVIKSGDDIIVNYLKDEKEISAGNCYDFIVDDMISQDMAIIEPNINNYQHIETKPNFWGGTSQKKVTDESYYADLERYNEKVKRDKLREEIKNWDIDCDNETYSLYSYNISEGKSNKLAENVVGNEFDNNNGGIGNYVLMKNTGSEDIDYENFVVPSSMIYSVFDFENINKPYFSELYSQGKTAHEIKSTIDSIVNDSYSYYVVSGTDSIKINNDFSELDLEGTNDNKAYFTVYNSQNQEDLYEINLNVDDGKLEKVNENISYIVGASDNGVLYYKDINNNVDNKFNYGTLYLDDELIDESVYSNSDPLVYPDGNIMYYLRDLSKDYHGTLCMYKDEDVEEISDDVWAKGRSYYVNKDEYVAFLEDYDEDKKEGTLKVYKEGKLTEIDDEVEAILNY